VIQKRYVSPRPSTSESLAMNGLMTAQMILPEVFSVDSFETSLNDDVA